MITVKGEILLPSGTALIPDGSLLKVKIWTPNVECTPPIEWGSFLKKINGYKNGDTLSYQIDMERPSNKYTKVSGFQWLSTHLQH